MANAITSPSSASTGSAAASRRSRTRCRGFPRPTSGARGCGGGSRRASAPCVRHCSPPAPPAGGAPPTTWRAPRDFSPASAVRSTGSKGRGPSRVRSRIECSRSPQARSGSSVRCGGRETRNDFAGGSLRRFPPHVLGLLLIVPPAPVLPEESGPDHSVVPPAASRPAGQRGGGIPILAFRFAESAAPDLRRRCGPNRA